MGFLSTNSEGDEVGNVSNYLMKVVNSFLQRHFNLKFDVEGFHLGLKGWAAKKFHINTSEECLLQITDLKIRPQWKLPIPTTFHVNFQSLTWKDFAIEAGTGKIIYRPKVLLLDLHTQWKEQALQLRITYHRSLSEPSRLTQLSIYLESEELEIVLPISEEDPLFLEPPFILNLSSILPEHFFYQPNFKDASWNGTLNLGALRWDIARCPSVVMHIKKEAQKAATLTAESSHAEGLIGELVLDQAEDYQLSGHLQSAQPFFSNYFQKYHEIDEFEEITTLSAELHSTGSTFLELLESIEVRGKFWVEPVSLLTVRYKKFSGQLLLNPECFQVTIPTMTLNQGKGTLQYEFLFDKSWELHCDLNRVEVWPLFRLLKRRLGIRGRGTGKIVYGMNCETQKDYSIYKLKIEQGEIVGKQELIDQFLLWKELNEIRRQLLKIEGFQVLELEIEQNDEEYFLEVVHLKGHYQQDIKLSGEITTGDQLNLMLEASFVQIATVIFSIKGHYKTPIILPAPTKMAEEFARKSQKAIKGLFGTLKDFTQ